MQKPSERHKLTSDNNIIKFKKPVHDPFKMDSMQDGIGSDFLSTKKGDKLVLPIMVALGKGR